MLVLLVRLRSTLVVVIWGSMVWCWWGDLNANNSSQFWSKCVQWVLKWKVLAADFRLYMDFYEFVAIFLFTTILHFSWGKIWVKYVVFWGSYLTKFLLAKSIHIWQLSLDIIKWIAKSRVFKNIWESVTILIN